MIRLVVAFQRVPIVGTSGIEIEIPSSPNRPEPTSVCNTKRHPSYEGKEVEGYSCLSIIQRKNARNRDQDRSRPRLENC